MNSQSQNQLQEPKPQLQQDASAAGEQYRAQLYAACAQGQHSPKRNYGTCGIITAICLFPCGLICLFTDSEKVCRQCGVTLDK